jgi:hypothetical protein
VSLKYGRADEKRNMSDVCTNLVRRTAIEGVWGVGVVIKGLAGSEYMSRTDFCFVEFH